jgi:hypothetical protein
MGKQELITKYTAILEDEASYEDDTPTEIMRGVLNGLKDGEDAEHFRYEQQINRQHMDPGYFQSVRWVWDDAMKEA